MLSLLVVGAYMDSRDCTVSLCTLEGLESGSSMRVSRVTSRTRQQGLFQFWCCIIVLAFVAIQNVGLATAGGIVLPVTRSFSQMEGSGAEEGSNGMTAEHARQLRNHDYLRTQRYRRVLTSVADFPLAGNEYYVGLYYTAIGLGTPSNQYFVQVDTGSDLLWVNCKPCRECPSKSDLNIALRLYDPESSTTSSNTSCTSNVCKSVVSVTEGGCTDDSCYYSFMYGDGSTAMGYLVEDVLTYDAVVSNNELVNSSAKVVFGCGFNQSGDSLTSSFRAVDGIMGLSRQLLSVITQLADSDLTTAEFAHCLQGDTGQGGIFVIGDVEEPGLVYTKLVPNQLHYNVALESIDMGSTRLSISPSVFDASAYRNGEGGTIFDSGTTMALLADQAYEVFVDQLTTMVSIQPISTEDNPEVPCFEYSRSDLSAAFPSVTLNFDGASMKLEPTNYLYRTKTDGVYTVWCLGWSRSSGSDLNGLTILGDIVLKNKLVVYDLANDRIGWVDFNCMTSVNVSAGSGNQVIQPDSDDFGTSGSLSLRGHHPIAVVIYALVLVVAGIFL